MQSPSAARLTAQGLHERIGFSKPDRPSLSPFHRPFECREDPRIAKLRDVEAQERACGLRDAEHVSRREDDVLLQAAPRDGGGIPALGQPAPQVEAAARLQPGGDAERAEPQGRLPPRDPALYYCPDYADATTIRTAILRAVGLARL